MPRFFFNVHDGREYPDLHGVELADLNRAREEAVRLAAKLLGEHASEFWDSKVWTMEVCDDSGLALFNLRFSAGEMPSAKAVPYNPPQG